MATWVAEGSALQLGEQPLDLGDLLALAGHDGLGQHLGPSVAAVSGIEYRVGGLMVTLTWASRNRLPPTLRLSLDWKVWEMKSASEVLLECLAGELGDGLAFSGGSRLCHGSQLGRRPERDVR